LFGGFVIGCGRFLEFASLFPMASSLPIRIAGLFMILRLGVRLRAFFPLLR
jgi:hypothetical protein